MNGMYSSQIEFIKMLHQMRTPWVDGFFKCLDFFDRQEFLFILIPAVWVGYHWKAGIRLFYILALSGVVNFSLKQLFGCPRPFHLDPSLAVIQVEGYGFPSGGAQTAVLLAGICLNYCRKRWCWILALSFVFLISLSRVYLGVHFPTDILGGWLVGISLWAFFTYIRPKIEKFCESLSLLSLFSASVFIPFLLLCLSQVLPLLRLCSTAMGVGVGVFMCSLFHLFLRHPKTKKEFILRAIFGAGTLFAIYALTGLLPIANFSLHYFIQFFSLGLWLSLGAALVWNIVILVR